MGDLLWGVDCSFDPLTEDEAKRLYDAGVRVFWQALATDIGQPQCREQNIINAHNAGMIACGYIVLVPDARDGEIQFEDAYFTLPDEVRFMLRHIAIDVEVSGLVPSVHIERALNIAEIIGFQRIIYTNWHTWVELYGNPPFPPKTLLWNAFWDNDADFDFVNFPYGGITEAELIGEQYAANEDEQGQLVDRNLFKAEFFGSNIVEDVPPPVVEEPPVVNEETPMDKKKIGAIIGIIIVAVVAVLKLFGVDVVV